MSGELTAPEPRTLFGICDDLETFVETLEMLKATPADTPEAAAEREQQIAEIERTLESIGAELVRKTDSIAAVIRRIEAETELIKDERERLGKRARAFQRADEWLRKYVLSVMQKRGLTQLKTATNTLFPRQSDALLITDAAAVPKDYKTIEVKMPANLWADLVELAAGYGDESVRESLRGIRVEESIALSAAKRDIKAGVEVPGADIEFRTYLCIR
jgi:hypothetical protein